MKAKSLPAKRLRWQCPPAFLSFYTSPKSFEGKQQILGQERALKALDTGLRLHKPGFHIYVGGQPGLGRSSSVRQSIAALNEPCVPALDRCYVYNFANPSQPLLLTFAHGVGKQFRDDMHEFMQVLRYDIPKTLEAKHVAKERESIIERFQTKERQLFESFAKKLKEEGFALIQIQDGSYLAPTVLPVVEDEPIALEALEQQVTDGKMTLEQQSKILERHRELSLDLKKVLTEARQLGKDMHGALDKLLQRTVALILDGVMDDLRNRYTDAKVRKHLSRVKNHILENIEIFVDRKEESMEMPMLPAPRNEDNFWIYDVNLLNEQENENHELEKCNIVEENNPSFINLFGAIEYNVAPNGAWSTDFRFIKAGSILKADGGYLIINAMDMLKRPMVWDHFKRVLRTGELIIQQPEMGGQVMPMALKPEPMALSLKVILVGPNWLYHVLWEYDEEFIKLFKVLADFDTSMELSAKTVKQMAHAMKAVCERGNMKLPNAEGLAALLEYAVEQSGQQDRISAKFTDLVDVLREAEFLARQESTQYIARKHIEAAIADRRERHGLASDQMHRMIQEEVLLIQTKGKRVGQINGLAVYAVGNHTFGKPSRITAVTSLGKAGLINIEREADLSGPSHNKGVLILSGYLRHIYGQTIPLSFSASIAFEQSYGGVDGDSASIAEIYALLSSFSRLPIDQGFAVTGSVNQLGDVQPIGGVNEKIEGFFEVCQAQGLTGKQGVIIPVQNEQHLMLRADIVEAVKKGRFHIYSIRHVDEGIPLLLQKPAGKPNAKGVYPASTVHGIVTRRLEQMAKDLQQFDVNDEPAEHKPRHQYPDADNEED